MMLSEIIPSHRLARMLMRGVRTVLDYLGFDHDPTLDQVVYVAVIVVMAVALGWLTRVAVLWGARKFVSLRKSAMAENMLKQKVLLHCSHILPPLAMLALIPLALRYGTELRSFCVSALQIYLVITIAIAVNAIVGFVWRIYDARQNTRNLPLKGILNTMQGIVWLVAVIIAVSIALDKSPVVLLTGLGAFAAALMLVFKDSILGFVAGIQLAQNNMLHVGDWIVVPATPANGVVLDMSLTTVKVQNFDNTIVTLPPYTLVSSSFQNWRGMKDSGARRIMRSILVETNSVVPVTPESTAAIAAKLPILKTFVEKAAATPVFDPGLAVVNGTVDTNLGLLRAYLCEYILSRPEFDHTEQLLVRTLSPTSCGIPLEIYCFTSTTAWTAYEAIQSALFEHIAAVAPLFGLKLFNYTGTLDNERIEVVDDVPKPEVQS